MNDDDIEEAVGVLRRHIELVAGPDERLRCQFAINLAFDLTAEGKDMTAVERLAIIYSGMAKVDKKSRQEPA